MQPCNFLKSPVCSWDYSLSCWGSFAESPPQHLSLWVFSCDRFWVARLALMPLIHVELVFIQIRKFGSSFIFLHENIQFFPSYFVGKAILLQHMFLASLLKIRWLAIAVWVSSCILCAIPLICMSVFAPVPHCFVIKIRNHNAFNHILLLRLSLCSWNSSVYHWS